jgi:carboxymethylenebutenolidase
MLAAMVKPVVSSAFELGYLAHPDGQHPGVVMIHDVWGLADHTRDLARRLAAQGYAVLAVDLYRDLGAPKITDPGAFIRDLSDPAVLAALQTAIDFLAKDASVGGRKVGMAGFCMGGMYAIHAAASCRGLSAAVPFYGMLSYEHGLLAPPSGTSLDAKKKPRAPLEAAHAIQCPTLAFFGADDQFIPTSDVARFEAELARTQTAHEVIVYPGAGHAFMNDTRPEMYREATARDAWSRMLAWLGRWLA